MSDDTPTPDPATARAAFLAAEPSTTWEAIFHESPGVMHAFKTNYPDRAEELEQAHARWRSAGKPASMVRTAPVATAPNPRPEPAAPVVTVPDPASIKTMHDLLSFGPASFNAFHAQHPERYAELARAAGVPVR